MSLADELQKLANLLHEGLLTREEFEEEKKRLFQERTESTPLLPTVEVLQRKMNRLGVAYSVNLLLLWIAVSQSQNLRPNDWDTVLETLLVVLAGTWLVLWGAVSVQMLRLGRRLSGLAGLLGDVQMGGLVFALSTAVWAPSGSVWLFLLGSPVLVFGLIWFLNWQATRQK